MRSLVLFPLLFSLINGQDPASFVNPLIGTANDGHVFPGATRPHGMVKVGMDTDSPGNHAGYDADPSFLVTGFSQMHDDGTGGAVPLSNFKIFPSANCSSFETCPTSIDDRKIPRALRSRRTSRLPGYFSSTLSSGVQVRLTATRRTSLQRYTFPPNAHGLLPRINQSSQGPTITIDPSTGRVTGGSSFQASFGPGRYKAFTCVDFRIVTPETSPQTVAPVEYGVWSLAGPVRGTVNCRRGLIRYPSLTLPTCANAEAEIPDFDFINVANAARAEWNDLLGRVGVEIAQGQEDLRVLFYSSILAKTPCGPPLEPYYDSFYCNWDTYRTLYPLYSLHDPERFAQIVRGMIDIQKHEGWLPECRGATQKQWVQGGSNGDPIVAEFFVKFQQQAASLNVSAEALYASLVADAEDPPPNFDLQGRQVDAWKKYHYLPVDARRTMGGSVHARVVSRALEYAFDDFTISQVAKLLGNQTDAAKYAARAGYFVNNWNPNTTMPDGPPSVVGMMQPRKVDGTFTYTDPRHCSPNDPTHSTCFLDPTAVDGFYEGSPLLYVPHDMATLIKLQGGRQKFIDRLDFIIDNGYFDVTDEPGQQIPFMYHYANIPSKSTQRSRQTITQFFNTTVYGLPGNDGNASFRSYPLPDSGAMGSYALFILAGLYPVPATKQFLLSSPYFPSVSFFNPLFQTKTTIRVKNFSPQAIFVKSVTVDGKPWKSNCFIEWDVFVRGATVELELTEDPNIPCGVLPPSLSTGGFA
ncbi:glycoside hydrolase family 92 protein [Lactarius indigo]|nr:glycoside hydrolase family 92 protein [Lactarius indigo]